MPAVESDGHVRLCEYAHVHKLVSALCHTFCSRVTGYGSMRRGVEGSPELVVQSMYRPLGALGRTRQMANYAGCINALVRSDEARALIAQYPGLYEGMYEGFVGPSH